MLRKDSADSVLLRSLQVVKQATRKASLDEFAEVQLQTLFLFFGGFNLVQLLAELHEDQLAD